MNDMSDQDLQIFEEIEAELEAARDEYEVEMAMIREDQAELRKRVTERIDREGVEAAREDLHVSD